MEEGWVGWEGWDFKWCVSVDCSPCVALIYFYFFNFSDLTPPPSLRLYS